MIEKLKEINKQLISTSTGNELKKQLLIQKLLNDNKCFFKMDIETAFSLLFDLKVPDIKKVYSELIDIKNYVS